MNVAFSGNWYFPSSEGVMIIASTNEGFAQFTTQLDTVLMNSALLSQNGRFFVEIQIQTIDIINLLKW